MLDPIGGLGKENEGLFHELPDEKIMNMSKRLLKNS